jgi:hypothetical protein
VLVQLRKSEIEARARSHPRIKDEWSRRVYVESRTKSDWNLRLLKTVCTKQIDSITSFYLLDSICGKNGEKEEEKETERKRAFTDPPSFLPSFCFPRSGMLRSFHGTYPKYIPLLAVATEATWTKERTDGGDGLLDVDSSVADAICAVSFCFFFLFFFSLLSFLLLFRILLLLL